jgi:hypothetical protein
MTPTTVAFFPPVARKEYLDRLVAFSPRLARTPELWISVHEEVQEQLTSLETEVRRRVTGIRVDAGQTKGDKFLLFSYRTFSIPDSALDPVVAGLTFIPAQQGVTVEADVSGEQTGDWISSVPSRTVVNSREEVLVAARESAQKLSQSADAIAAALKNSSRTVE